MPSHPTLSGKITEAAARLIARDGADHFTMGNLARESGVGRATLYRHVHGREELFAALSAAGVDLGKRFDVQDRIIAAARTVFSRGGFDAATLEDVAREAGVAPATVYRQFNDKDGLIRAFGDRFGPRREVSELSSRASGDLRTDLERVALTVLRSAQEERDLLKLALIERLRGGRWAELLRSSPFSARKSLGRLLKAYAQQGQLANEDPRQMAQAFQGLLFSFLMGPLLEDSPLPDPEQTARFIARVFLEGLGTPPRRRR